MAGWLVCVELELRFPPVSIRWSNVVKRAGKFSLAQPLEASKTHRRIRTLEADWVGSGCLALSRGGVPVISLFSRRLDFLWNCLDNDCLHGSSQVHRNLPVVMCPIRTSFARW